MNLDSRLLKLLGQTRVQIVATILAGLLTAVFTILQAHWLSRIISGAFLKHATLHMLLSALIAFLVFAALRAVFIWAQSFFAGHVAAKIKQSLRNRLAGKILEIGPVGMTSERSGEMSNTLLAGVDALDAYFSQYIPQLFLSTLIPLLILFFVFPNDILTGFVFLLTAPVIPAFMILIGNITQALTKKQWKTLSRLSAHFLDVLQGLTTLKVFGRSRDQVDTIYKISHDFRQRTMNVLRVAFLSALVLELVATLSTAIVAVEIGLRLLYAKMSFQDALFVLILAPEFYLPLRLLGTRFHAGMEGVAAAQRIFEILEEPGQVQKFEGKNPPEEPLQIEFRRVSFSYGSGGRPALRNVSFTIPAGKRTAVVGPTGAGKSTLAHLLLKFVKPHKGNIFVNGFPLTDLNAKAWRQKVAWVPQNPYLFHGTIGENIRLARPDASVREVAEAAQKAELHDFISSLPQGYDTPVGERGTQLSGGQAQRVALARAFLKNAPFLILDEPTSNLDPEIEERIQSALEQLVAGRTVLYIAHRLSTVFDADQILVLSEGQLLEAGTHAELSRKSGLYAQLLAAYGGAGA